MNKDNYRILKELNSLEEKIPPLEKSIESELSRITKIENLRDKRSEQLELDKSLLLQVKNELSEIEFQIAKKSERNESSKNSLNSVFDEKEISALTKQIETLTSELDELENIGFEKMESIEHLEQNIKDAESFLNGSLETLAEIESEIKNSNEELYNELKVLRSRHDNSLNQLPEKVKNKYLKLKSEKPNLKAISEITQKNTCTSCGYLVPMALVTALETHQKFSTCSGCGRILIPQGSKFL